MLTPRRSPMLDFVPTAGSDVNTTTGYQLVARAGIGISGLGLPRGGARPLSGRSHGAAGAMGGLHPRPHAGALLGDGARREDGDVDVRGAGQGSQLDGYLVGGSNGGIRRRVVGETMVEC
ncbi:hypothetical protein JB92DRAFT_2835420 [Gautieria morchelliformis]|nr:hypothetical protein JB92DRAFT_2835420 [Gautieria morchelliformis]